MHNIILKKEEGVCVMNDITLRIKSALFRTDDTLNENYRIIGSEIKAKRLALAKTLQAVSSDICSVSYLCKIEQNKIVPNRLFLREICKKLQMQNSKIDALMSLKESIVICIKALLNKDYETIKNKYLEGKSLINYRYKIIELIYYISIADYASANKKIDILSKLCKNMEQTDLIIFSMLSGILSFYNQDFYNSTKCLDYAIRFSHSSSVEVIALSMKFMLFSNIQLNDQTAIFTYYKLINLLFQNGYLDLLDDVYFAMSIYLLFNNNLLEYKKIFVLIKNESYKRSLYLLSKLIFNKFLRIKREWINNVIPMLYYLGLIKIDINEAKKEVLKLKPNSFNEFFNPLYLQYLLLEDDEERLIFINNVALPTLEMNRSKILSDFILNEMASICKRASKYKNFTELFLKLKRLGL